VAAKRKKLINKINHGDCITLMECMLDGSVDLAFADPPFNIGYQYDEYQDQLPSENYLEWSTRWMKQVHRVLKPARSLNVPATRGKYQVSSSGLNPSVQSWGLRIQVSSGSRPPLAALVSL